jgi:hypothetical protein
MAKTLDSQREDIRTSIHGRRFGLTHDDYLAGGKALKKVVTNATSDTTGTVIPNHGFASVESTTDDGFTLADPEVGVEVTLAAVTTSTGVRGITLDTTTVTIISTNGTAGSSITIDGLGDRITLVGYSTSQYLVQQASCAVSS